MTRGWTFYEFIKIGMTFKEHRKIFLLLVCFSLVALRDFSVGQEINERGWPIPYLRGLSPYKNMPEYPHSSAGGMNGLPLPWRVRVRGK